MECSVFSKPSGLGVASLYSRSSPRNIRGRTCARAWGSPSLARYPGERKRKRYSRANTFNVCQGAPKPDPKARPATCSRDLCLRQIASGCRCGASSSPAKVLRSEEGQCRALTIVCRRHNVTILDRQHACNQGFIQRRVHKPALLCDNGEERPGVCNLRSLSLCDQF